MTITHFEEILKRRPQEINDHNIIVPLPARPHNPWHTGASHERLVDLGFLAKRAVVVFCKGRLELDCNLLACDGVHSQKNGTYGRMSYSARRDTTIRGLLTTTTIGDLLFEAVFPTKGKVHARQKLGWTAC